jgi:hypothetical protein
MRARLPRLCALLAACAAGSLGCASEADLDEGALPEIVARAADDAKEDDRRESSFDAALEQMTELGNDDVAALMDPDERACIEGHPDLADLDLVAAMSDADAVEDRVLFTDVLLGCIEGPQLLATLFVNNLRAQSGVEISTVESECVIGKILRTADDPARLLVVSDGEDDIEVLGAAFEECLTAEHYAAFTGAPGAGPQTYGDDDRLDAMQDDCEDGSMRACDLLFLVAGVDSDYEQTAATCGGTQEDTGTFCGDEAELDDSGFAPADSPGLEVLALDCEEGDLTACDLLYQLVPFGHELENLGFTCGGRIAVGAVPDCRTRLG